MSPHRLRSLIFGLSSLAACCMAQAAPVSDSPVLQLSGADFPELVVHVPALDVAGEPAALACEQIRSKRIDELDPLWKQAVDRIHLDCEDLDAESAGLQMVATVITAYLQPGKVQFAGVPVAEIRMMDSELWSDHQYLLDRPYSEVRAALQEFLTTRCRAGSDDPTRIMQGDCTLTEEPDGLYMEANQLGGIWVHPEKENPARTVYAEAWSD